MIHYVYIKSIKVDLLGREHKRQRRMQTQKIQKKRMLKSKKRKYTLVCSAKLDRNMIVHRNAERALNNVINYTQSVSIE